VKVSDVDPGEPPLERAAAELSPQVNLVFEQKGTRKSIAAKIRANRDIPVEDQEYIIRRINVVDPKHEFLKVAIVCHPHKGGFNSSFTVSEL